MNHFDVLAGMVDLRGVRAVDVGAGDGAFARQLTVPAANVVAVEIDESKVRKGTRNTTGHVEFRVGRAEDLPVESASADLVCFMFSFHHVPADAQVRALEECARVLRPGGRLHEVQDGGMPSQAEIQKLPSATSVNRAGKTRYCCGPHEEPGCFDTKVAECVCKHDPFCCDGEWDKSCAQNVEAFLCARCEA